ACVQRLIASLEHRKGIEEVHIVPGKEGTEAQLCFHYDAAVISIQEVEKMAADAGADITQQYGHLLIEVAGIRQPRHARLVESELRNTPAVISAAVSGTGFIQLEYDQQKGDEQKMLDRINQLGLDVKNVEAFHEHGEAPHEHGVDGHDHSSHDHNHDHDHAGHGHKHTHGRPL